MKNIKNTKSLIISSLVITAITAVPLISSAQNNNNSRSNDNHPSFVSQLLQHIIPPEHAGDEVLVRDHSTTLSGLAATTTYYAVVGSGWCKFYNCC